MPPKTNTKQQSEEDLLLQDFSRNLSAKSTALFYGNALIVSAIPICEFLSWFTTNLCNVNCLQTCFVACVDGILMVFMVIILKYNIDGLSLFYDNITCHKCQANARD